MLAPWWCVNEGTSLVFAFVDARSAINDYALLLTKSARKEKIIIIIKKIIIIIKTSRIEKWMAVSCHKMRALVNSMQNSTILYQHIIIHSLTPNGIFEKFTRNSKELKYTKLTLEIMNKLTLEMQSARDPSNCITMVEYKLHPLAGTGPNHNI